jgi:two-component system nitrate/nitrite response regulator NarL
VNCPRASVEAKEVNENKGVVMLRAVVVDDAASLRMVTSFCLENDGVAEVVGHACDGDEGLDLIVKLRPDVAIIDMHMPGIDGVELIEMLRLRDVTSRLVAYSSDEAALITAMEVGADAAVLKEPHAGRLLDAVAG